MSSVFNVHNHRNINHVTSSNILHLTIRPHMQHSLVQKPLSHRQSEATLAVFIVTVPLKTNVRCISFTKIASTPRRSPLQ